MVEQKINALTQSVLGAYFARNVTMKLTPADLNFILPAARGVLPARAREGKIMAEAPGLLLDSDANSGDPKVLGEICGKTIRLETPTSGEGYKIALEVWSHGSINLDGLLRKLEEALLAAQMDYEVEASVGRLSDCHTRKALAKRTASGMGLVADLPSSSSPIPAEPSLWHAEPLTEVDNPAAESLGRADDPTGMDHFGVFFRTMQGLLPSAVDLDVPSIKRIVATVTLPPWVIEQFVGELQEVIAGIITTTGIICLRDRAATTEVPQFEVHKHVKRDPRSSQNSAASLLLDATPDAQQKDLFFTLAGLSQLQSQGGFRRLLPGGVENNKVVAFTYNWKPAHCELLFGQILRVLSWNHLRIQFLQKELALLQQKGTSARHLSFRFSKDNEETEVVPASYGGDLKTMAMATHFQQQISASSIALPLPNDAAAAGSVYGSDVDTLQRHAVEFLDWLARRIRFGSIAKEAPSPRERSMLLSPFLGGNAPDIDRRSTADKRQSAVNVSDMAKVLRSVRLLHFVKYPIMFTDLRHQLIGHPDGPLPGSSMDFPDDLMSPTLSSQGSIATPVSASPWTPEADDDEVLLWYKQMLNTYLKDYVAYLRHLGLEPSDNGSATFDRDPFTAPAGVSPRYWVSNRLSVETDVTYLVRWFKTGVIVAQIGVDGIFGCINLYTLNLPEPPRGVSTSGLADGFGDACKKLKNDVHLSSYAYDFHLRYFQSILDRRIKQATPVDILLVMKAFSVFNPRKANFARSRIHRGSCAIDDGQVSTSLFQYILKNPLRYGFCPILHGSRPIACSLSSTSPEFSRPGSGSMGDYIEQPENVYTIVVYSTTEGAATDDPVVNMAGSGSARDTPSSRAHQRRTSGGSTSTSKLRLRYFLLVVNMKTPFPLAVLDNTRTSAMGNAILYDPLHEYLAGGYYLKDIVRHAERKVERLIEQAIRYYGRDNLWRQLLRAQDPASLAAASAGCLEDTTGNGDGMHEWAKLFLEKIEPNSRALVTIDASLAELFSDPWVQWSRLLDHLQSFYKSHARELIENFNGSSQPVRRHLVLFNPRNEDYLLHFVLRSPERHRQSLKVTSPTPSASPLLPAPMTPAGTHLRASSTSSAADSASVTSGAARRSSAATDTSRRGIASPSKILTTVGIEAFAVSREGVVDEVEYTHISDVVNTISAWLWSETARSL
ncbi:KICSTOR complex protein szt2 [Thoreauomyces humboldtii]|nr:KICSTOR complex protein szt2 [Thoreauomyces humboldtii]